MKLGEIDRKEIKVEARQALENWERQLLLIREWQDAAASHLDLSDASEAADNDITDAVAYINQATKVRRGAPSYAISSIDDPEDPEHQGGGLAQEKADEFAVHVYQCIGEVGMALDSVISYLDNGEGTGAPDTEFLSFRAELLTALKEGRGVLKELGAGPGSPSNPAYQAADAVYNDDDNGDIGIEFGGQPIDTNEVETSMIETLSVEKLASADQSEFVYVDENEAAEDNESYM